MTKLHELLAAEKTPMGAWNAVREETLKKFKAPGHFFEGHSKSLTMIEETEANKAIEAQAREEKPVTTTVYETLEFALDLYAKCEDVLFRKNATNRLATGDVMWKGAPLLVGMPVDELLGLEARLTQIRGVISEIPTLDATKHWEPATGISPHMWKTRHPEETTKTEKTVTPVVMSPATKEHPAQVQVVSKDNVVGRFTTIRRSGAATALQKADTLKRIDELLVEVKQARMRANETEVVNGSVGRVIVGLILDSLYEQGSEGPY